MNGAHCRENHSHHAKQNRADKKGFDNAHEKRYRHHAKLQRRKLQQIEQYGTQVGELFVLRRVVKEERNASHRSHDRRHGKRPEVEFYMPEEQSARRQHTEIDKRDDHEIIREAFGLV